MLKRLTLTVIGVGAALSLAAPVIAQDSNSSELRQGGDAIQLGPRPFYLVQGLDEGTLKDKLRQCQSGPFSRTDFSIGHRGAPLQFPEHTDISYRAAAREGAGIVECDVTFTKDGELVCRHSECDLQTTTNIVATPLNSKCTTPWSGPNSNPVCCTSDITLAEFKTLEGKMESSDPSADTPEGYLGGTPDWRTDLYVGHAKLMTLNESIQLNEALGVKHAPELKSGNPARIAAVFGSQEAYAQKMINTFKDAGVRPKNVWVQSFDKNDVLYWIQNAPAFGKQAVYLDPYDPTANPPIPPISHGELVDLWNRGVRIIGSPMFSLLAVTDAGKIVVSDYAKDIRGIGFDIIAWTFERTDLRNGAAGAGFYYLFDPQGKAIKDDADMYKALDVMAKKVGIIGMFSDWPATVTYYANCNGLR